MKTTLDSVIGKTIELCRELVKVKQSCIKTANRLTRTSYVIRMRTNNDGLLKSIIEDTEPINKVICLRLETDQIGKLIHLAYRRLSEIQVCIVHGIVSDDDSKLLARSLRRVCATIEHVLIAINDDLIAAWEHIKWVYDALRVNSTADQSVGDYIRQYI